MMKKIFFILFISLLLFQSCNKNILIDNKSELNQTHIENRLFFVIHGDGSYLYHNQKGNELQADQEMLKKAIETAESLENSEVFIFHIKQKRHFLIFFPLSDRDFYHYRNRRLIDKISYSSKGNLLNNNDESLILLNAINNSNKPEHSYFFYYGHEIPETDSNQYDSSYPERRFTVDTLSILLNKLSEKFQSRFDLVTISTCNNGSPYSLYKTLPFSSYVLASPGDLHLSYIDCRGLIEPLNKKLSTDQTVNTLAKSSFDSLCLQTNSIAVLALYKRNLVLPVLENLFNKNNRLFYPPGKNSKYVDCIKCDSNLVETSLKAGTTVFYRAPLFGRMKNVKYHSGWICK